MNNISDFRIGNGYDVHAIAPGLRMWLCGVCVSEEVGFVAHSDGDVAIHALCDAMLGALALGDIGKHFPDSDPAYKGIDSKILLARTADLVHKRGYQIGNLDLTICLQTPKLSPHIMAMRECLASILGLSVDQVSVKATTTEHLGFTGRGEGCAVYASVIMVKSADLSLESNT